MEESMEVTDKGITFVINHYNQILELLGKIYFNKGYLSYFGGAFDESKLYAEMGTSLINLANNETTMDRYLCKTFQKTEERWKEDYRENAGKI